MSNTLFLRNRQLAKLKNLCRYYAADKPTSPAAKIVPPPGDDDESFIDMDTEKLTKLCCVNYLKEGKDIELKPDSEYPTWLFEMRLGKPVELSELDPNYYPYWQKIKEIKNKQLEIRKFIRYRSSYVQKLNLKKGDKELFEKDEDRPVELH